MDKNTNLLDLNSSVEETIDYYLSESIRCCVKERNYYILCMRLGLLDGEKKTLQEVGEVFDLSRERIRQIESKCYQTLRYYSREKSEKNHSRSVVRYLYTLLSNWISPNEEPDILYIATLIHRINKIQYTRLIVSLFYPLDDVIQKERETITIIKDIFLKQKEIAELNHDQTTKFNKIFKGVAWPKKTTVVNTDDFNYLKPQRQVNYNKNSISGEFFSEKNKCIIEYESNVEYRFCMYLEYLNDIKKYIQQPIKISYSINGNQKSYYPDFLVLFKDGRCALVEIKPKAHMMIYYNILKYMALQKYCIQKGIGYLISDNYNSINEIVSHKIDQVKLKKLVTHLKPSINWSEYKQIREDLSLSLWETNALILHGNLKFTTLPYSIKHSEVSYKSFIEQHKKMTLSTTKQANYEHKQTEDLIKINNEHIAQNNSERGRRLNEYSRWTNEEENLLIQRFKKGLSIPEISKIHSRKRGGIIARLKKLGLIESK